MTEIIIRAGQHELAAELHDTDTARALAAALPVSGTAATWGDEFYFPVPVQAEADSTFRETVTAGDICFWPPGNMFCVFFGPTPMSAPGEIRPASAVNVIGRLQDTDPGVLRGITAGTDVTLDVARNGETA